MASQIVFATSCIAYRFGGAGAFGAGVVGAGFAGVVGAGVCEGGCVVLTFGNV
jgi:hypothetical protein